jgi:hypothetical protein
LQFAHKAKELGPEGHLGRDGRRGENLQDVVRQTASMGREGGREGGMMRMRKKTRTEYSTAQCSTAQYSTVQYSTVQYSTVQHSTVESLKVTSARKAV